MKRIGFKKVILFTVSLVTLSTLVYTGHAFENRKNTLSYVYDESVNIPEPKDAKNVPSYVKWEPKLGIYIREDMYYDEKSKRFKEKEQYNNDLTKRESSRIEEWLKVNKNSNNKLYQAIIRLDQSRSKTLNFSTIYDVKTDPEFKNSIIPLGVEYVPQMLELAFKDNIWNWQMLAAVESITNIKKCLPDDVILDSEPSKHSEWKSKFKYYMKNAKDMVKSEKGIEDLGMFALPLISDEIENGNDRYLSYLSELIPNDNGIKSKSSQELKELINSKSKEVSILRSILESYK